ncbi:MAG: NAD(P)/FAD-dependent oxidoreductase [Bacillota bacterium]
MSLIRGIENVFGRRSPAAYRIRRGLARGRGGPSHDLGGLPAGTHIIVIGGGIAGSAFTRQILRLSAEAGLDVRVTLLNSTACNYCGGLLTRVSRDTLETLIDFRIPTEQVLGHIEEEVYVTQAGETQVPVGFPLYSILRTDKFGYPGFDDTFREEIRASEYAGLVEMVEPAVVTKIERVPGAGGGPSGAASPLRWRVTHHRYVPSRGFIAHHIEGDVVVLATGLRSLRSKLLREFANDQGYGPPPMADASVTEVDSTGAAVDRLEGRMLILDNVVPGLMAAIIPKRPGWLTMTSLGRVLTREDIATLFADPHVRKYIDLTDAPERLRCKSICPALIYTGPAAGFYGDGWLAIGDLTGHGRVLKDGYFSALLGAHLAAVALLEHGASREALARHYHRPLKHFNADNRVGMFLYHADQRLMRTSWFPRFLVAAAKEEGPPAAYGGAMRAAVRGLSTGEMSYRWMLAFFAAGLIRSLALRPFRVAAGFLRSLFVRIARALGQK